MINSQAAEAFTSAEGAARWVKGLLLASLVLSLVGVMSSFLTLDLLSRAATGGMSDADAAADDARQALIGALQALVYIATSVAFLAWFYRAHKNLAALGGRYLKYTPGWAVGGFFVPLLNLVRPLQVMREVWHGSDPTKLELDTAPFGPSVRNQLGTPSQVGWWWALALFSAVVNNQVMRGLFRGGQTIEDLQQLTALLLCSDLLNVPSTLIALSIVGRITRWQQLRVSCVRDGAVGSEATHFSRYGSGPTF